MLSVAALDLDPDNPRLDRERLADQRAIAHEIIRKYRAVDLAESVAEHGYFNSEPLIAVRSGSRYTVLEGNRRLAALKGLRDPELAGDGTAAGERQVEQWRRLASLADEHGRLPQVVPVMVVTTKAEAWPIIGFRHIAGVQTWDPHAKATFIVERVDESSRTDNEAFADVAQLTGERVTAIRSQYRNWWVLDQARRDGDDELVDRAQGAFGVFTRAMSSVAIRSFIGAPAPADMSRGDTSPATHPENLPVLLRWLYGDDEEGSGKVIEESRDLRDLATVLAVPQAVGVLRKSGSLTEAVLASGAPREGLVKRLERAASDMDASTTEVSVQRDNRRIRSLVHRCRDSAQSLLESLTSA